MTAFKLWLRDTAERVGRSFVASFTSLFVAADLFGVSGAVDLSVVKKAGIAGLTAGVTTLIAIAASWANTPTSASFLKPPPSPPAPSTAASPAPILLQPPFPGD